MILRISIQQSKITMELIKNKRIVDSEVFSYYHDLDEVLIIALDKLLKRNNIDPVKSSKAGAARRQFDRIDTTTLNSFKILENTGKNSTSYKVAASFVEGLKVGV